MEVHFMIAESTSDLAKIWERFVSGQEVDLSTLRPHVAASWYRCRALQVQPRRDRAPQAPAHSSPLDEDLTRASGPVVSFLNDALVGAGTLIDLANRDAKMLLTIGGNRALDAASRINGLPGSLWDEPAVGTNVLGTGIVCRQPLEIKWHEHYVEEWHKWACCSAPIFHPFQGELLGILAIAGFRESAHPRMLALAIHASGLITDSIRKVEAQRRLVLSNAFEDFARRYPDAAIVALDGFGYVAQVNGRVGPLLGTSAAWSGRRLGEMPGLERAAEVVASNLAALPRQFAVPVPAGTATAIVHPVSQDSGMSGNIVLLMAPKSAVGCRPSKEAWTARFSFADILGDSEALRRAVRAARNAAITDHPIVLIGESGTGKELFAHAIHEASTRRDRPFVAFNCGTLSPELAVAEMCGHEPGAFTGADRRTHNGVLDTAHGGTLFLDELQDMDPKAQSLLLRFLETGTFVRVGGTYPVKADVRVVAAANISIGELQQHRIVRPDLLYRLTCVVIEIPPLRERPEDIRLIGERCLRQDLRFTGSVEEGVWVSLRECEWAGNVRELRNVLLRATLVCAGDCLTAADLPADLVRCKADPGPPAPDSKRLGESPSEHEELTNLLRDTGGDVREAARRLGIHRSTLYRRLARQGLTVL
jgi:sigma-54 dependent transcriptional regulator, acetoin dehydrogenase operon transcriptional activator AcoR